MWRSNNQVLLFIIVLESNIILESFMSETFLFSLFFFSKSIFSFSIFSFSNVSGLSQRPHYMERLDKRQHIENVASSLDVELEVFDAGRSHFHLGNMIVVNDNTMEFNRLFGKEKVSFSMDADDGIVPNGKQNNFKDDRLSFHEDVSFSNNADANGYAIDDEMVMCMSVVMSQSLRLTSMSSLMPCYFQAQRR